MKDTSIDVELVYYRRLGQVSMTEKGRILVETVSSIRAIARHSIRHLPEPEQSIELVRRLFGDDLSLGVMIELVHWLQVDLGARLVPVSAFPSTP